ncbi:hypothetical protein POTOM_060928 [Populus tomentosa]|uniref:Phosphoribosylformimino-5-aminoimidazole carboxamide ribotide isomerase n=1 Tax=Populus tomentosa TaxID=118781 RepID=A0A8X8C0M8_POPTO|nr:hypothetical protein POTOM_060928 [Populus tomentosa]
MASSSSSLHSSASSSHKLLASRKVFSSSLFNGFKGTADTDSLHPSLLRMPPLGKVKQIVGSTLRDLKEEDGSALVTNFESDKTAAEFANMYKEDGLMGGHVIMLGADDLSKATAIEALRAYPGSFCVFLSQYVFNNGQMDLERLKDLVRVVGKQKLVLDLSCRKKEGRYAIVTDRWQKFSDVYLDEKIMIMTQLGDTYLSSTLSFLLPKQPVTAWFLLTVLCFPLLGIDEELVALLGRHSPIPVTYAGGVTVMNDLERIKVAGDRRVDVTVGSALDIFGGNLPYKDVVSWHTRQETLMV